jgi:hypothetical protein
MLGKQLYLSKNEALRPEVVAVRNDDASVYRKKPAQGTGLWTSTWQEETQDSGWVEWCRGADFGEPENRIWFLLTPAEDARLLIIDSYHDMVTLIRRFPLRHRLHGASLSSIAEEAGLGADHFTGFDFERMAEEYDGLHLTEQAAGALHLSYPLDMNSWDCESTCWFRWVFTDVERIAVPELVQVESEY